MLLSPVTTPSVIVTLLANCVLQSDEEAECEQWPECEQCELVKQGYMKLPQNWREHYDPEAQADWYQLCALLLRHVAGTCDGRYCIFCMTERIPL